MAHCNGFVKISFVLRAILMASSAKPTEISLVPMSFGHHNKHRKLQERIFPLPKRSFELLTLTIQQ